MYHALKRILDTFGGLLGLVLFGLAYLPIGIAIRREDGGPILVALPRVSQGKTIKLYKFRSMMVNAERLKAGLRHLNERSDGPFFKVKDDPRITRVGKIIRRYRLDELPQFINVIKGELSLVGPRPHEPGEVQNYPKQYRFLAKERAGITGLSQVSGASSLPFLKELELDSAYIKKKSLLFDFLIIGKTIAIFLFDPSAV